jgi:hypothetical protein
VSPSPPPDRLPAPPAPPAPAASRTAPPALRPLLGGPEPAPTEPLPPLTGGSLLLIDERASVQFGGGRGFVFRVIRVRDWPTYDGWAWIDGYQLDAAGDAVARRDIFVRLAGLRAADPMPAAAPRRRTGVPRQRPGT